jgi:hypothetical protein
MRPIGFRTWVAATGSSELVLVPRVPNKEMQKAGWFQAHDEDAAGAWEAMITAREEEKKDRELAKEK